MTPEESLFEALKLLVAWDDKEDENIRATIAYHFAKALRKREKEKHDNGY